MESFETGENQNQNQNQTFPLSELSIIKQLILQLQTQLNNPSNSTIEISKRIASQLLAKTENSIHIAKSFGFSLNQIEPISPPRSASASPRSDMSDLPLMCQDNKVCKKRKTQPKWKNQVRVGSMGGGEGPLDDGYSWRKYGQKDILGAKHPRAYYRCTHRNTQSCLATKQVQRTDEDPTVFDVIYHGNHTCLNKSRYGSNSNNNNKIKQMNQLEYDHDYLNSLKASLTVKTEGSSSLGLAQKEAQACNSISFSFPSTPIQASHMAVVDNNGFNINSGFLPSFANSPATSESNYFSIPSCTISGYGTGIVSELGFPKVNSDLTEIISSLSAATSTTNSPIGDVDQLVFDGLDFDPSNFF